MDIKKWIKEIDLSALVEAFKDLARVLAAAVAVATLGWLTTLVSGFDPNSAQFIIATLVLKMGDKYVHKSKNTKANGLLPF